MVSRILTLTMLLGPLPLFGQTPLTAEKPVTNLVDQLFPDLQLEDEILNVRFEYFVKGPNDPAVSWSHETENSPPLSARDAIRIAEKAKILLLAEERDYKYQIRLERVSLVPLRTISLRKTTPEGWLWVVSYEYVTVNGIPLQGEPLLTHVPVLMTGQVPLVRKPRGVAHSNQVPDSQISDEKQRDPSSEHDTISENDSVRTKGEKIRRGQFSAGFNWLYDPFDVEIYFDYVDLPQQPLWKVAEQNPPLSARDVLKLANERLKTIRLTMGAPEQDVRLYQLSLFPIHDRWYWGVAYELDNHDESFQLLTIPVFFDRQIPPIKYEQ